VECFQKGRTRSFLQTEVENKFNPAKRSMGEVRVSWNTPSLTILEEKKKLFLNDLAEMVFCSGLNE
jgi:hypothetical protein